jgi:hypothetical protein
LYEGEPERIGKSVKDEIISRGGFDYEFNE